MFVTVQISDELYQTYAERSPERPQKALADTLKRFQDLDPSSPQLVISVAGQKALGQLLDRPATSEDQLIEGIRQSRKVTLGEGVEIILTPGQLQRLKAQADFLTKTGKASQEELNDFVKKQVTAALQSVVGA